MHIYSKHNNLFWVETFFFFETKAVTIQVAHFLIFESRGNGKLIKSDKLLESE